MHRLERFTPQLDIGQWRTQFMAGVGDKHALLFHEATELACHRVEGDGQRPQFVGCLHRHGVGQISFAYGQGRLFQPANRLHDTSRNADAGHDRDGQRQQGGQRQIAAELPARRADLADRRGQTYDAERMIALPNWAAA